MNSGMIQFIQTSPDELKAAMADIIRHEVEKLKADFQPKQPTEYMTRQQVAAFFNVDLATVWNWTKRGKLQAYGMGNRVYYRRDEVEASLTPLEK